MGLFSFLFNKEDTTDKQSSNQVQNRKFTEERDKSYFANIIKEEFPDLEIQENVSLDSLGWVKAAVYIDREKNYPTKNFDFVLLRQGTVVGIVMVTKPNEGALAVFKNTKETAASYHVPFVNFFTQFPSEREYIVKRFKEEGIV